MIRSYTRAAKRKRRRRRAVPSVREETALREEGYSLVAGLDEVGRGPLAGPVVAGVAILPPGLTGRWVRMVRDSKLLTPEEREQVAALMPLLGGDFSVNTLAEQGSLLHAVTIIVEMLRVEMESMVATNHPAHEIAVAAYFDFAHAFSVQTRLNQVGLEMEALVELVTGGPVTDEIARDFAFPD